MHCLLCHEKIPRLRVWRTKSEFCCEEHAALYKKQTLERLLADPNGTQNGHAGLPEPPEPEEFEPDEFDSAEDIAAEGPALAPVAAVEQSPARVTETPAQDEAPAADAEPSGSDFEFWERFDRAEQAAEEPEALPSLHETDGEGGMEEVWRSRGEAGSSEPSWSAGGAEDSRRQQSAEEALEALRQLASRAGEDAPKRQSGEPAEVLEMPMRLEPEASGTGAPEAGVSKRDKPFVERLEAADLPSWGYGDESDEHSILDRLMADSGDSREPAGRPEPVERPVPAGETEEAEQLESAEQPESLDQLESLERLEVLDELEALDQLEPLDLEPMEPPEPVELTEAVFEDEQPQQAPPVEEAPPVETAQPAEAAADEVSPGEASSTEDQAPADEEPSVVDAALVLEAAELTDAPLEAAESADFEAPEPDWDLVSDSNELSALKHSLETSGAPPVSPMPSEDDLDVSPVEPDWQELEELELMDIEIEPPEPVLDEEAERLEKVTALSPEADESADEDGAEEVAEEAEEPAAAARNGIVSGAVVRRSSGTRFRPVLELADIALGTAEWTPSEEPAPIETQAALLADGVESATFHMPPPLTALGPRNENIRGLDDVLGSQMEIAGAGGSEQEAVGPDDAEIAPPEGRLLLPGPGAALSGQASELTMCDGSVDIEPSAALEDALLAIVDDDAALGIDSPVAPEGLFFDLAAAESGKVGQDAEATAER